MIPERDQVVSAVKQLVDNLTDGARVDLVSINEISGQVTLLLKFADASCADCVLAPGLLRSIIVRSLRDRIAADLPVVVIDPRLDTVRVNSIGSDGIDVLDPTSGSGMPECESRLASRSIPPAPDTLLGKVVGIRRDIYWQSWNKVSEHWASRLESAGAKVVWWRHRPPVGKEAATLRRELDSFIAAIDLGIFGMCNCGACTMWTIEEALAAIAAGRRSIVVSTEHFVPLARTLAERHGVPDVPITSLPFPIEGRSTKQLVEIADTYYESMVSLLVKSESLVVR